MHDIKRETTITKRISIHKSFWGQKDKKKKNQTKKKNKKQKIKIHNQASKQGQNKQLQQRLYIISYIDIYYQMSIIH